jgi:hypothetical protein
MCLVTMVLAALATLLLVMPGYASIMPDQRQSAALLRNSAVQSGLLHPLLVSRQIPSCITSDEFKSCFASCDLEKSKCTELGQDGNCTKAAAPCSAPNCCLEVRINGTTMNSVACSKSCCISLDENGNQVPSQSCSLKSSAPIATKSSCFPAHATVELESGLRLRMDELRVGHRVRVAKDTFSDVFLFTHKLERATAGFVFILTASGHSLSLTPGHYIYANGATLVPAASVQVGDELTLASGALSPVVSISEVVHAGVYNPQTLHGDIVIDGIVASTYTTAVSPMVGHASLSPLRALYSALGLTAGLPNGGADYAAWLLPGGVHSY